MVQVFLYHCISEGNRLSSENFGCYFPMLGVIAKYVPTHHIRGVIKLQSVGEIGQINESTDRVLKYDYRRSIPSVEHP